VKIVELEPPLDAVTKEQIAEQLEVAGIELARYFLGMIK
jgi:hypothetical protein